MSGAHALSLALATGAAFFFGIMVILSKRGLVYVDPQTGALVAIGTSALAYTLTTPFWLRSEYLFSPGFWVFFANGFMYPTLSMYLSLEAVRRTGPTVAATLAATTPLWATLIALLFLHERLTLLNAAGTLCTVGGVMVLTWIRGRIPRLLLGALLFASGAAVVRALNHNLGRYGLTLLPQPMMAGWVSYCVSFTVSTIAYVAVKRRLPTRLPARGVAWCAAGGLCVAVASLCMYGALEFGHVVSVAPIVSVYPAFTMLAAALFRQELLTPRIVLGVLVTMAGVVLVAMG